MLVVLNLLEDSLLYHPWKSPGQGLGTAKEGGHERAGRDQLLGI